MDADAERQPAPAHPPTVTPSPSPDPSSLLTTILRSLDFHLRLPVYWKDRSLRYLWTSFTYAELLGCTREEILFRSDEDLFPAEVARLRRLDDEQVLREARPSSLRIRRESAGVVRVCELFRLPIFDESGVAVGLLGIEQDVTKQTAVIADLELNRLLLEVLMDTLPDSIYFKDLACRFLRTNKATAIKFGMRDPSEVVGKSDFDLFSRQHAEEAFEDEQQILRTRVPVIGKEEKETWPDGRVSWVSTTKVPVVGTDGKILGTFGITRDITRRKQAQLALEESERKYRELIENANDIIYTHDIRGNLLSLNKAAEQATGYHRDEASSLHVQDLVVPEHRHFAHEMTRRKLEGKPTTTYELDILSKDGRRIPLEVSTRILYQDGKPVAVQGIARDITERKRAQAALEEREKLLAEQARELARRNEELSKAYRDLQDAESLLIHSEKMAAIGQLVAGLAHEINNPAAFVLTNLTTIERDLEDVLTYASACDGLVESAAAIAPDMVRALIALRQERAVPEAAQEIGQLLESMRSGMHRIRDIVANLRVYSRADTRGGAEIADLVQGIEATIVLLRPVIPRGVVVEVHPSDTPAVECNVGQVNQVFMNLIVNAVQAVGDEGRVDVYVERADDGVRVRVIDDGPGIPESIRNRIFDPFFTTKEVGKGTGLGLTICRRIIDAHHGAIEAASEPGQGAEFRVWLPLRQPRTFPAEAGAGV